MKTYCREHVTDYEAYAFGYCNYAVREAGDDVSAIYNAGYLPFSGDKEIRDTFYMARSARVRLNDFTPSSENRRVLRKFDDSIIIALISLDQFDTKNHAFRDFCFDYFTREHGAHVLPEWRFDFWLTAGIITHVAHYKTADGITAGYVFLRLADGICHYWYSFYAAHMKNISFGMYMMLDCARHAAAHHCEHYYLGTAYGNGGRYKLNFPALEYWTGAGWSGDLASLKAKLLADSIAA